MKSLRFLLLAVLLAAIPALADVTKTVPPGSPVTFALKTLTGTPPIAFQWTKDGINIPGATNVSYTIPAVTVADSGTYEVLLTNIAGSAKSDKGIFTVAVLPSGLIQINSP